MPTLADFSALLLDGTSKNLADYSNQVVLIVNVASKCGFTGQYAGLEKLYRLHKDSGFVVLGFPCNQFLFQEPGDGAAIQQFCSRVYQVSFPIFAKVDVNGKKAHPLYQWLTETKRGFLGTKSVKWNFTKFLLDRSGTPVKRFGSGTTPESIGPDVERLLKV
jgi:glutathione peroxidase